MKPSTSTLAILSGCLALTLPSSWGEIRQGSPDDLGTGFLVNEASMGGGDHNARNLNRDFLKIADPGSTLTLTGTAWALASGGNEATALTLRIIDAGPDGILGTFDDVVAAELEAPLTFNGAGVYVWSFPEPVVIEESSGSLQLRFQANGPLRWKTLRGQARADEVKLSLAGTAVGGEPRPVQSVATRSGPWHEVTWTLLPEGGSWPADQKKFAVVGRQQTVRFEGVPATLELGSLQLGESPAQRGQGIFYLESGSLHIKGDLRVGVGASENDSFLFVSGGKLRVDGNADFGRSVPFGDGSLIVGGGLLEFGGDLSLGRAGLGGSMLRFHNPGTAAPIEVKGTLHLHRASLDFTFDEAYTHVPGTVIPLVRAAKREGQFLNFRNGQEFNRGPHRFRLDYDVNGDTITATALAPWTAGPRPPNVILIFSDDQGYADTQINEHPFWGPRFPTPRLQELADRGVRFTDAYVSGGVCHPSRVGLLTGINQNRLGNENNMGAIAPHGMPPGKMTIPDRLQALGFRTYGLAKWHLGETVEYHPNLRGFDRWYGMWGGARSYYVALSEIHVFQDQMTPMPERESGLYLTDRIGDASVDFIAEHLETAPDQPFFMYVAFTSPHGPNDLRFDDPRFERLEREFGLTQADYLETPMVFDTRERTQLERFRLAGMTLALDENIGKIIDKLEAQGLMENTIIVYLSDNGGPGYTRQWGGNWSYNTPLRGLKGGSMLEGSIRVPATLTWEGTVPSGQVIDEPVIALDMVKSFLTASGAPREALAGLEGIDLLPLLQEGTPLPENRALFWRMSGPQNGGSAIRVGDWKLHIVDSTQTASLYNLRSDIGETRDLSARYPERAADLKNRFLDWEAGNLAPFFNQPGLSIDDHLEHYASTGVYRLNNRSEEMAWLSFVFRTPYRLDQDFHLRAKVRPLERNQVEKGQIAYGLGNSDERENLLQLVFDFSSSEVKLIDPSDGMVSVGKLPRDWSQPVEIILNYHATTRTLEVTAAETRLSLRIPAHRDEFSHFAVGTAGMAGDLTGLIPTPGISLSEFEASTDFPGIEF